jgi:hypothetical protein
MLLGARASSTIGWRYRGGRWLVEKATERLLIGGKKRRCGVSPLQKDCCSTALVGWNSEVDIDLFPSKLGLVSMQCGILRLYTNEVLHPIWDSFASKAELVSYLEEATTVHSLQLSVRQNIVLKSAVKNYIAANRERLRFHDGGYIEKQKLALLEEAARKL